MTKKIQSSIFARLTDAVHLAKHPDDFSTVDESLCLGLCRQEFSDHFPDLYKHLVANQADIVPVKLSLEVSTCPIINEETLWLTRDESSRFAHHSCVCLWQGEEAPYIEVDDKLMFDPFVSPGTTDVVEVPVELFEKLTGCPAQEPGTCFQVDLNLEKL